MSLRSQIALRAPDVLRSLKRHGVFPTIGTVRQIGQRPPGAPYGETILGVFHWTPLALLT